MPVNRPIVVGQAAPDKIDNDYLIADQDDLDRGERNGSAYVLSSRGDISEESPLQLFYKFGAWYDTEMTYEELQDLIGTNV